MATLLVQKSSLATPDMSPRGHGMTWWADHLFIQEQLRDLQITELAFPHHIVLLDARPETLDPEQYDSAWEEAGTDDDKGNATSQLDADLNASTSEETDALGHSHRSLSADRCRQRNHTLHRDCNWAQWEFCKPQNCWLSFPLFRETTKEDAISYRDWHSKVEEALERGHNPTKVKEVMFVSLEGIARDNTKMIDDNGDLQVTCTLDGLDSLYGVSMTFQLLNAALCGLQQKAFELPCTYYNHMAQIVVILCECHGNWYWLGELVCMSKDCFYVGLLPENWPMVVHLKDQPHTMPLDLLRALLEQVENDTLMRTHYPQLMSARLNVLPKLAEHCHQKPQADKRTDGYTVCSTQLDAEPVEVAPESDLSPTLTNDDDILERWYNDGFLIGLRQAAEISEYCNGRCFNCQKEGHHWHQCKEPLSPELQELADKQDKEHKECEKKALNPQGGTRAKGGHAPTPSVGANLVVPQVAGALAQ